MTVRELSCYNCTKALGIYFDTENSPSQLIPKDVYCNDCYVKEYCVK